MTCYQRPTLTVFVDILVPQSMLGPLTTPGTATRSSTVKKKGSFLSRTPLTPR